MLLPAPGVSSAANLHADADGRRNPTTAMSTYDVCVENGVNLVS